MRLNQALAVEKTFKAAAEERMTKLHHMLAKTDLLAGLSRTYQKRNEEDPELPPPNEHKAVQLNAEETLIDLTQIVGDYWDAAAAKEATNCLAKADVIVEGKVLLKDVPATLLLFLEKQLVGLHTYVTKLPVLDPAEEWSYNQETGLFIARPKQTIRTKKVPRSFEKSPATDKHPAQVDSYMEDVAIGTWTLTLTSGAIPETRRRELVARVELLQRAVKAAREAANMQEVVEFKLGKTVFDFLTSKR